MRKINRNTGITKKRAAKSLTRFNNKGSVLFLIVAIMSVLIIMASAVYYTVNAQKTQTVSRYSDEQSYQSALALNDIITKSMDSTNASAFITAIASLGVNETVSTTALDAAEKSELAAGLGDYKVSVRKVSVDNIKQTHVVEITTEVEVNGVTSSVSTIGEFTLGTKTFELDRFFTATGYAPNDVIMTADSNSTLYLDNEYTQFGPNESSGHTMQIASDILCGGTARFNNIAFVDGVKKEVTIGNNAYFYFQFGSGLTLGATAADGTMDHGVIRVGGNMAQRAYCGSIKHGSTTYIVGDFITSDSNSTCDPNDPKDDVYVNGNLVLTNTVSSHPGKMFVNGNVYFPYGYNKEYYCQYLTVGGNVYYDDTMPNYRLTNIMNSITFSDGKKGTAHPEKFIPYHGDRGLTLGSSGDSNEKSVEDIQDVVNQITDEAKKNYSGSFPEEYRNVWPGYAESPKEVIATLNEKLQSDPYTNWDLSTKFGDPDALPVINETFTTQGEVHTISVKDGNMYKFGSIKAPYYNPTIVFDTEKGDGTYENIYLYLEPNCMIPEEDYETTSMEYVGWAWGDGLYTMHYWGDLTGVEHYEVDGNTIKYNGPGGNVKLNGAYMLDETSETGYKYVGEGRGFYDAVTRTVSKGQLTPFVPAGQKGNAFMWRPAKSTGAGDANCHIMVRGRGSLIMYLPEGVTYMSAEQSYVGHLGLYETLRGKQYAKADGTYLPMDNMEQVQTNSEGHNRIKAIMDSATATITPDAIQSFADRGVYIHNNIFLVTTEKNAEIDMNALQNFFTGFIYAPYMTLKTQTNTQSGIMGGLIVSDYDMNASTNLYVCSLPYDYYDQYTDPLASPEDKELQRQHYMQSLMSSDGYTEALGANTTRKWKKYGYN